MYTNWAFWYVEPHKDTVHESCAVVVLNFRCMLCRPLAIKSNFHYKISFLGLRVPTLHAYKCRFVDVTDFRGMAESNGDGFSFPVLEQPVDPPKKLPLTAFSTVTDKTDASTDKPVPIYEKPARSKVPLEKGYTQVDWLRLSKSGADLNGQDGRAVRRDMTLEEVAQHSTADDAWMALRGKVYNIGPYLRFHPGGAAILIKAAGKDGTALFTKYHPWVNADALLEKCLIGFLAQ